MLGSKGLAVVLALIVLAVFLVGEARSRLDRIAAPMRESFQDMVYLPRGDALKILACGFDAPLADALYIKGLIYFSEAVLNRSGKTEAQRTGQQYTYDLFDVITDLSPRFIRAYQMGSIFLSSAASLDVNLKGQQLLEKGVGAFDKIEAKGETVPIDPRWLFHLLQATTYEVNIASKVRASGDIAGAAEAKQHAAEQFQLAAQSPQAPGYVVRAAVGYRSTAAGGDLFAAGQAILGVWHELYREAVRRNDQDLAAELEKRAEEADKYLRDLRDTRLLETELSRAGRRFRADKGRLPDGLDDLARAGYIPALPATLPLDREDSPDRFLVLPDGSFRSEHLAEMEKTNQEDYLFNVVNLYRRANKGKLPPDMETLVREKYLPQMPVPPLAELGQIYRYNPASGLIRAEMPDTKAGGEEEAGPKADRLGDSE